MDYRGLHSYRQRVRVRTLFPNIFFVLFLYVERVCESFWKESLTRTSSTSNAARALSSGCFQLSTNPSTNPDKDFCRYLWSCGKKRKQIECRLAWHRWNSPDLGIINWHVFKVLLWSKNHFLLFFQIWKPIRLTSNWQNFELCALSEGCLFWV